MVFDSQYVCCPYYKDETGNAIKCEGLFSEECVNTFMNKKHKKDFWEEFCCDDYGKCPLADALEQKLYESCTKVVRKLYESCTKVVRKI